MQTVEGCDSTVFLDLTVLNPTVVLEPPDDLGCNVSEVLINASMSTGDVYSWFTSGGFICSGDGTPVITACAPGIYCLTVTSYGINEGNTIECTDEMCVE